MMDRIKIFGSAFGTTALVYLIIGDKNSISTFIIVCTSIALLAAFTEKFFLKQISDAVRKIVKPRAE
jgi:hypothetical protein